MYSASQRSTPGTKIFSKRTEKNYRQNAHLPYRYPAIARRGDDEWVSNPWARVSGSGVRLSVLGTPRYHIGTFPKNESRNHLGTVLALYAAIFVISPSKMRCEWYYIGFSSLW